MSVIHVSEEEAARELGSLIEKVRAGVEVRIDRESETVAVLRGPEAGFKPRRASEALRRAEARGSDQTFDDRFGDDVEAGMRLREKERFVDPWESF
jgi:antitoxin (DNA-binding transcriptional repressor) of toxin-antitoxin stability system